MLQTMAVEYGPKQIRFNAVSPVVGSTGMYVWLYIGSWPYAIPPPVSR